MEQRDIREQTQQLEKVEVEDGSLDAEHGERGIRQGGQGN